MQKEMNIDTLPVAIAYELKTGGTSYQLFFVEYLTIVFFVKIL
jgi:hypothetical protein